MHWARRRVRHEQAGTVKTPVSLQRRLLQYLLIAAPLVWALALLLSAQRARHEVNELFDTELVRLARQVQIITAGPGQPAAAPPAAGRAGDADLRDLAVAVWDAQGTLRQVDREGAQLPYRPDASGFVDLPLNGHPWRVFYLPASEGHSLVAAGQRLRERDELVWELIGSQLLPWFLVLPLLLLLMAWAVRRALAPVRGLTDDLQQRRADDLRPLAQALAPQELQPLVQAMNGMFGRIELALERERRFTADAAHELRTPLAALRAQWDVLRHAAEGSERQRAEQQLDASLQRMDRLVTQMLALSRLEAAEGLPRQQPLDWPSLVEQVVSDLLPLAERRRIEIECDWPEDGRPPLPLHGDADLMRVLLRNLLDNALRYAPEGSTVRLAFGEQQLTVCNDGPAMDEAQIAQLGQRFHRADGQAESGSGLGVSIVRRIAALHGLRLQLRPGAEGHGLVAELQA